MPKYENAVIYKLKHNLDYDDENIYIGSTSNFKNRKYCHKKACNNEKNKDHNYPVYQFIRKTGHWDEWVMIAIEEYPCYSKKELEKRERYHIDLLRPTLNKYIPTRTEKEYYEANKERIKKYREDNKEKRKEYREVNKELIKEKRKKDYENNKEKLKEKVICDHCGIEIRRDCLKRHQRSNKCINFNKEKINEKVICDHCGSECIKYGLKRHQRSNKCINFVKKD